MVNSSRRPAIIAPERVSFTSGGKWAKSSLGPIAPRPGPTLLSVVTAARADYSFSSVSSAFWKRPACDRSALARVSNHSAISSNFSSRAVFAIPGYISVYS